MREEPAMVVYFDSMGEVIKATDAAGKELPSGQISAAQPIEGARIVDKKYFSLFLSLREGRQELYFHASTCKWWCLHLKEPLRPDPPARQ